MKEAQQYGGETSRPWLPRHPGQTDMQRETEVIRLIESLSVVIHCSYRAASRGCSRGLARVALWESEADYSRSQTLPPRPVASAATKTSIIRSMELRQTYGKVGHSVHASLGRLREGPVAVVGAGDQAGL